MTIEEFKEKYKHKRDINHILDFIKNSNKEVDLLQSYQELQMLAENWTKQINNITVKESGEVKLVKKLNKDFSLVKLIDTSAKEWEGKHMQHCVSSYTHHDGIYSIRDNDKIPKVTFEIKHYELRQCKGKKNNPVSPKYSQLAAEAILFLINKGEIRNVGDELDYIGYKQISRMNKAFLQEHFINPDILFINQKYYFNVYKKIKQKKRITEPDRYIFNLFCKYNICDESLKPIIKSTKDINALLLTTYYNFDTANYPLASLIERGKIRLVNYILSNYNLADSVIKHGITACCKNNNLKMFNKLINLRPNLYKPWHNYVLISAVAGSLDIIKQIYNLEPKRAFRGLSPSILNNFILDNNTEAINWWFDNIKPIDDRTIYNALRVILRDDKDELFSIIDKHHPNMTGLVFYISKLTNSGFSNIVLSKNTKIFNYLCTQYPKKIVDILYAEYWEFLFRENSPARNKIYSLMKISSEKDFVFKAEWFDQLIKNNDIKMLLFLKTQHPKVYQKCCKELFFIIKPKILIHLDYKYSKIYSWIRSSLTKRK